MAAYRPWYDVSNVSGQPSSFTRADYEKSELRLDCCLPEAFTSPKTSQHSTNILDLAVGCGGGAAHRQTTSPSTCMDEVMHTSQIEQILHGWPQTRQR